MIQYGSSSARPTRALIEAAGELARGVAAHAVGDDHDVIDFLRPFGHVAGRQAAEQRLVHPRYLRDEELILVVVPQEPCMRERADVDLHERREGLEPPERGVRLVFGKRARVGRGLRAVGTTSAPWREGIGGIIWPDSLPVRSLCVRYRHIHAETHMCARPHSRASRVPSHTRPTP